MINFVFCFLFGVIIGVAGAVFASKEEIDSIKTHSIDPTEEHEKHYLLDDPMYPITLHQLRIFASQQRVELEELVNELDEKGYVVHWTKAKLSPCFTYLKVQETLFEECGPEAYVILKIMTKEYYNEISRV